MALFDDGGEEQFSTVALCDVETAGFFGLSEALKWIQARQMFQLKSLKADFESDVNRAKHPEVWKRCFIAVRQYHLRQNVVAKRFMLGTITIPVFRSFEEFFLREIKKVKIDKLAILGKTEVCKYFLKFSCPRDAKACSFAHGEEYTRQVSRVTRAAFGLVPVSTLGSYRTHPCKYFILRGVCPYGNRCAYRHGDVEVNVDLNDAECLNSLSFLKISGTSSESSPSETGSFTSEELEHKLPELLDIPVDGGIAASRFQHQLSMISDLQQELLNDLMPLERGAAMEQKSPSLPSRTPTTAGVGNFSLPVSAHGVPTPSGSSFAKEMQQLQHLGNVQNLSGFSRNHQQFNMKLAGAAAPAAENWGNLEIKSLQQQQQVVLAQTMALQQALQQQQLMQQQLWMQQQAISAPTRIRGFSRRLGWGWGFLWPKWRECKDLPFRTPPVSRCSLHPIFLQAMKNVEQQQGGGLLPSTLGPASSLMMGSMGSFPMSTPTSQQQQKGLESTSTMHTLNSQQWGGSPLMHGFPTGAHF